MLKKLLATLVLLSGLALGQSFSFSGYSWHKDGPWAAPGGGTFDPANIFALPQALVLQLTQTQSNGIVSSGAEVISTQTFGYGTFQFTAAVYPVESGQVASGFLYINGSQTEIDVEETGNLPTSVFVTNYNGLAEKQFSELAGIPQLQFHSFKIVWRAGEVDYYVDGKILAQHCNAVPSVPANFLFNFWGTNSTAWGGLGTVGTRYMYISSFSYTPQ